ncbi:MAG TPA: hypothetical protein VFD01_15685 [Candidatus Dormibacteraeota bacterium]|nr:hypothetical protein [Candidatus Dormibacteraeota bacterium]
MESRVVELRERGRRGLRTTRRAVTIGLGLGAAVGLVALGALVAYRLTRPPSREERLRRLLPRRLVPLARGRTPRRLPPVHLSIGERQESVPTGARLAERLAVQVARTVASAAAGAFAARLLRGLAERQQR